MIYNIYNPNGTLSFSIESSNAIEDAFSFESMHSTINDMLSDAHKCVDTLTVCSTEGFKEGMKTACKAVAKKFTEILDKIGELFDKIRYHIQKIIVGTYKRKFETVIEQVESIRKDFTRSEQTTVDYNLNRYLFKFKGDVSNVYSKIPGFKYDEEVFETLILCDSIYYKDVDEFFKDESIDAILNDNNKDAIEKIKQSINEKGAHAFNEYTRSDAIVLDNLTRIYVKVDKLDMLARKSNDKVKNLKKALKELEKRDTMYGKQEYILKRISVLNSISKRCSRGVTILNTQIILPIAKYKWYTNRLDEKE